MRVEKAGVEGKRGRGVGVRVGSRVDETVGKWVVGAGEAEEAGVAAAGGVIKTGVLAAGVKERAGRMLQATSTNNMNRAIRRME